MLTIVYLPDGNSISEVVEHFNIAWEWILRSPSGKSDKQILQDFRSLILSRDFSDEGDDFHIFVTNYHCFIYTLFLQRTKKIKTDIAFITYEDGEYMHSRVDDVGELLDPWRCRMWDFDFACLFHDATFLEDESEKVKGVT